MLRSRPKRLFSIAAILVMSMMVQVIGVPVAAAAPPAVLSSSIADDATGISTSPAWILKFSEPITLDSVNFSVTWQPEGKAPIDACASVQDSVYLSVGPVTGPIQYGTWYTVTIPSGMVKNGVGEPLASNLVKRFQTEAGGGGAVPAQSVSLSDRTLTLTMGQASGRLTASVLPANATNKAVTWESSNTAVARVDAGGNVSAIGQGNCTVTVRTVDGGFRDTCAVTVQPPGGGGNIGFEWVDSDTDHVYYAGNDISFKITGLDRIPDATPVRVAVGILGEQGFNASAPVLVNMLSGGPYYYLPATVSGGQVVVSGKLQSGLGLGVLGCQIGTSSDGGVTWTPLAPAMPIDPPGDRNTALIEVNVPDSSVVVTPSLKTIQNLYNTEIPVKFAKMTDTGHGLQEFGSITFGPGLNLIDGKDQFSQLDNPNLLTMLGAINLATGEVQYFMGVNTSTMAFLASRGATVSISSLPPGFSNVAVTNRDDVNGAVANIILDNGVLRFDVNHFSTYVVDGAVPPQWPAGSSLDASAIGTDKLTLNWTAATDNVAVTQYRVYRGNALLQTLGAQQRTLEVTGLSAGSQYTFKVEAGDAAGAWTTSGPSITARTAGGQPPHDEHEDPPANPTPPPVPRVEVTEGRADVSAGSSTTRTVGSDGSQTVNVTLSRDTLNAALANPEVKEVVVKIAETARQKAATVAAASLSAMAERQAALIVQAGGANLSIPARAVQTPSLSSQLNVPAEQIQVKVSVQEVHPDAAQELKSKIAILDENLRPVGNILELRMEASAGDKSVSIDSFGETEVTGEIPFTPASVQGLDVQKLCVYRFNDSTGSWEPVRSRVDSASGKVVFYTNHFSKYAIMSFEKTFGDMAGHWAKEEVELMAARWVVQGDTASTFAPERNVTRAEFCAMLARALGLAGKAPASGTFTDVGPSSWYFGAVEAAVRAGLVGGSGGGKFEPERAVTREEMAVMAMRGLSYAGKKVVLSGGEEEQVLSAFQDKGCIQAWSSPQVAAAVKAGIVCGADGKIMPGSQATRAQGAVMIHRLMSLAGLL